MSLSTPFIRRPVATTLLTFGIAAAGAVAFFQLPVSPLPQVDFPTISVRAQLPGASPEMVATSVATPLERHLGQIADVTEMTSSSTRRLDAHHPAVRPQPRHRRRRARRAGGDQCGARRPADEPALQPDLPQGQSGRRADPDPGADLRHAAPGPALRRRLHRAGAEAVAGRRRRRGHGRRQLAAGGARRAQSAGAVQIRHRARGRARRARVGQRPQPEGRDRGRRPRTTRSTPTTRRTRPPNTAR